MLIALSLWQGRIAPVFDVSRRALLASLEDGRVTDRLELLLRHSGHASCAALLRRLEVQLLVCGAISRGFEKAIQQAGIQIVGFACGDVDAILDAVVGERLWEACFRMPGSVQPFNLPQWKAAQLPELGSKNVNDHPGRARPKARPSTVLFQKTTPAGD